MPRQGSDSWKKRQAELLFDDFMKLKRRSGSFNKKNSQPFEGMGDLLIICDYSAFACFLRPCLSVVCSYRVILINSLASNCILFISRSLTDVILMYAYVFIVFWRNLRFFTCPSRSHIWFPAELEHWDSLVEFDLGK